MAFTQIELDALKSAYAAGQLTVKINDRLVTYDNEEGMRKRILFIEGELNAASVAMYPRYQVADFSE